MKLNRLAIKAGAPILILLTILAAPHLYSIFFSQPLSHLQCERVPNGVNAYFYQRRQTANDEAAAGKRARDAWKNAWAIERFFLSDDIVLGRSLVGMEDKEVINLLGKPREPTYFVPVPHYNAKYIFLASQCDLCLVIHNGKVVDTYLDLNF